MGKVKSGEGSGDWVELLPGSRGLAVDGRRSYQVAQCVRSERACNFTRADCLW